MNWVVREVEFGVCRVKGKQGPRERARDNETEGGLWGRNFCSCKSNLALQVFIETYYVSALCPSPGGAHGLVM